MLALPRIGLPIVAGLLMSAIMPTANASALPVAKSATSQAIVRVHHDLREDRWNRPRYRHNRRHHYRVEVVDAPYTHVETGRHVIVDAPFAHVYFGPRGHHIVAPFVDL